MDDYELPDGSDSAESDSYEQNSLRTINDVKEFMISTQAWSSLREDFRGWLKVDKRHDGKDPSEKMQDEETEENQADCVISSPYNTELQGQKSLSYEPWTLLTWFTGHCRTYILKIMDFMEQFRRPLPPLGYKRITWRSAYSKPLYIDVKEASRGGAEQLQERLRKSATLTERTEPRSSSVVSARMVSEPGPPPLAHVRRNPDSRDSNTRETGPAATNGRSNLTASNQRQRDRRYLLLCFSTSKSKSFRQIHVTDLSNDQYLFQRIYDVYWEIRSAESWISRLRLPTLLRLPSWIYWCFDGVHFITPKRVDFISVSYDTLNQG
jgi:hypothetical protein